jgi:oxaloacetate decarboxylase gamma subunit
MAETTLLQQGVDLMLYGMSTVFLFLALLVIAMITMSYLVARVEARTGARSETATSPANGELDGAVVAAITAALHQHRQRRDPSQRP